LIRSPILALLVTVLISLFSTAHAHKPLEVESDNNSMLDAMQIPDHEISWAINQELQNAGEVDYYSFDANKGDELFAEMTVPKLAGLESFTPSVALVGYDINSTLLEHSSNVSLVEINSNSHSNNAPALQVPANASIVVGNYNGTIPSAEFYEPFTQTSYWERQELIVNKLPSTGTYFLAVFDNQLDSQDNDAKKYTLAVGKREDFRIIDYFTTLPMAWFNTKFFFNDYLTPSIAIILLVIIPSSIVVSLHFLKLRKANR
jgi:hypothetical protein